MQGRRLADNTSPHTLDCGEYTLINEDGKSQHWYACTPDGRLGNLILHTVVENEDGSITVSPSILVSGGSDNGSWHGYLENGIWREC